MAKYAKQTEADGSSRLTVASLRRVTVGALRVVGQATSQTASGPLKVQPSFCLETPTFVFPPPRPAALCPPPLARAEPRSRPRPR